MHTPMLLQRTIESGRSVCLALQGGGALGALTWGVLDALLRHEVTIDGVSGASAGAVNAVVLADGLLDGGPVGARAKLSAFWRELSVPASGSTAAIAAMNTLDRLSVRPSPALLNPFSLNPLRELLHATVDFERLRRDSPFPLFVAATRVSDGRARIFRSHELTLDAVLASACLPQIHEPVEIDGETYWDGGYSANPPLMELVRATRSLDLLVVELTMPTPRRAEAGGVQIERRLRDFALNAALQRELDTLLDLQTMCRAEPAARSRLARRLRRLRVHRLSPQGDVAANALDPSWAAISRLSEGGVSAGERWLTETS